MTHVLTSANDLLRARLISPGDMKVLDDVAARYSISITPELRELIRRDDPNDPIARQFVPSGAEFLTLPEERLDPIGDETHSPVPGIVHRHRDRALFKIVGTCPVYCRFCFRRESVGPRAENALSPAQMDAAVAYIADHSEIWEVILTGGDPFILSARRVQEVTARFGAIPHVKVIRWHTRVPFTDPAHVTSGFAEALRGTGAATWVALHANHPREFTPAAHVAINRLVDTGIPLVSQSVLLKGVNDDVGTLESLMRAFVEHRIKPYYLHHPDLAPGTSHFRPSIDEGLALMCALRARLSGLAMPAYVLDIPGGYAKVSLESANVERTPDGWRVRDHEGRWHLIAPLPNSSPQALGEKSTDIPR